MCKCDLIREKLNSLVEFLSQTKKYDRNIKLDPELIINELDRIISLKD